MALRRAVIAGAALALGLSSATAQETDAPPAPAEAAVTTETPTGPGIYIQEYRVEGGTKLTPEEVAEAVYPYLGPGRNEGDVEQARAALEAVFQEKGYQTVAVEIPQQDVVRGVVKLQVVEAPVGRLRVRGSRYFSLKNIKDGVPSLAEGTVPNFNEVARDIVALNQLADRRVVPELRPGVEPGTVDIDLKVEDTFPLHGSLELNNRYSANTTPLRLNGSLSYSNLWQLGHTIGGSFQIAPERLDDAVVYSGFYLAPVPWVPGLSVMVQGTRQNSNVSTLGGGAVAGNGEILGGRVMYTLPAPFGVEGFFHSVSFGVDYKNFGQDLTLAGELVGTPITYYPFGLNYNAAWVGEGYVTEFNAGLTFSFAQIGSDEVEVDNRRFNADGSFIYLRGDIAHTRDLPYGFELYGQIQGQGSGEPLVDSEQFAGGGLDTVRGYLESEVLGDNAFVSTVELRSPSFTGWKAIDEWRVYGFSDFGWLALVDPLPEQTSQFRLASLGAGTRIQIFKNFNGSLDAGLPLISQTNTEVGDWLLTFRVWGDF